MEGPKKIALILVCGLVAICEHFPVDRHFLAFPSLSIQVHCVREEEAFSHPWSTKKPSFRNPPLKCASCTYCPFALCCYWVCRTSHVYFRSKRWREKANVIEKRNARWHLYFPETSNSARKIRKSIFAPSELKRQ